MLNLHRDKKNRRRELEEILFYGKIFSVHNRQDGNVAVVVVGVLLYILGEVDTLSTLYLLCTVITY